MSTGEIPIISVGSTGESATHDGFDEFCRAEHANLVRALSYALGDAELGRDAADEALARAVERWQLRRARYLRHAGPCRAMPST